MTSAPLTMEFTPITHLIKTRKPRSQSASLEPRYVLPIDLGSMSANMFEPTSRAPTSFSGALCYAPQMRKLVVLALFATLSMSAQTKPADSPERRLAAQNALFEEFWQTTLKLNPTQATAVGDYRYNDKLGDNSLAAVVRRNAMNAAYLAKIKAISTEGFGEEDRTSHDLFLRNMQENVDDFNLKNYEMPVTAQGGVHTALADLPNAVPLDSVKHYEDYIARLHQIPKALLQTEDVLRAGVKDHLVIVKFVAEKIPAQCAGIIAADPFVIPIRKMPADFSDADKKRLADAITTAVNTDVLPAYKQFASFIATDYAPHGRATLSIES